MTSNEHTTKVGVGVMIFREGKVLLGKRKSIFGQGEYCFPGGHLEYGESFEHAVLREAQEETGLVITELRFEYLANNMHYDKHYIQIAYSAVCSVGEPQCLEPDKCEGWDWYPVDALPTPLFRFTNDIVVHIAHGRPQSVYDL
jgi:8-oxo-dGTP diphosphatase